MERRQLFSQLLALIVVLALGQAAGVNAAKIKKIFLGVGDRSSPSKGGAGLIYLDDIRVAKP